MSKRLDPRRTTIESRTGTMRLDKLGVSRFDFRDPYHFALTLSWPEFFAVLIATYLAINFAFGLAYFALPGSIANLPPGSLTDAFFFSVETLATVGYGFMAPATRAGHVVATVEIFVGMMFTATVTGLFFVRFSKPKAKIVFADTMVVTQHAGQRMLMVRIGNGRLNPLTDAVARITVLMVETGPDGHRFRRTVDLKLARPDFPYLPLTWTIMHALDEDSPLRPIIDSRADRSVEELRLMLSVTARDPSLGAQVYAIQGYRGADIAIGMRYADAVTWDGEDRSVADMRRIGDIEPDVQPAASGDGGEAPTPAGTGI